MKLPEDKGILSMISTCTVKVETEQLNDAIIKTEKLIALLKEVREVVNSILGDLSMASCNIKSMESKEDMGDEET